MNTAIPTPRLTKVNREGVRSQVADRDTSNLPDVDFMAGGKWFVEAVQQYGVNERGDKLRIYPILLEGAELIADFRIKQVATSGAAQVWKSIIHWNLV